MRMARGTAGCRRCATMCYMRYRGNEVGVRELRQNLSVYLRRVKAGQALEVRERGTRVAMLVPARGRATVLEWLIETGRATPARGDLLELGRPLGRRPSRRASRALRKLRDER
jgi:prevent-host-death family protein